MAAAHCAHFWTLPIHVSPNRALMRTHGRKDYTCLTPTSAAPAKEPCNASSSLATDLDFHSAHPPTPIPQIGAIHPWAKNRVLWSKNCHTIPSDSLSKYPPQLMRPTKCIQQAPDGFYGSTMVTQDYSKQPEVSRNPGYRGKLWGCHLLTRIPR